MSGLSREDKDLILKKLDVVSKELREIHFYEVAKELGFKHINTEDVRVIIGKCEECNGIPFHNCLSDRM